MFSAHLDVPKAFPNADIDYDVYMHAPPGIHLPHNHCYKLLKSLYGLKQAARLWNKLLTSFLLSLALTQCLSDTCLFYSFTDGIFTIVCIYVDDIMLLSTSEAHLTTLVCFSVSHSVSNSSSWSNSLGLWYASVYIGGSFHLPVISLDLC